jgi:hypothetical protein
VRDREAERLFLTTSKTDQQKDFQSAGTDGYEVKKDFAGPRLVENAVKKPARARIKKLGPDEWVFSC